jgi:hypothetical protein
MKKIIFSLVALLSLNSAFALSMSPASPLNPLTDTTFTVSRVTGNNYYELRDAHTEALIAQNFGQYNGYSGPNTVTFTTPPAGDYIVIDMSSIPYWLQGQSLATYRSYGYYQGEVAFTVSLPPPPPNPLTVMVNDSTSTFMATTGFTPSQSVTSVGGMFILPFLGGMIMLMESLLPWIIALAVLSAMVFFSYRAFLFYGEKQRGGRIKKK